MLRAPFWTPSFFRRLRRSSGVNESSRIDELLDDLMELFRLFDEGKVAGVFKDFQAGVRDVLDQLFGHAHGGDEVVPPDDDERGTLMFFKCDAGPS
jgi:hypothetical protein